MSINEELVLPIQVSITSVEFHNFKALSHFSISLQHMNILVGPNNCGKSTILGAFRALAAGMRRARTKSVELVPGPDGTTYGYRLNEEALPISVENVHTDYAESDSWVVFRLSNRNKLQLFFPQDGGCILIPIPSGKVVRTPAHFKSEFPITIGIVPVLGPIEHEEELLREETVKRNLGTHRASRNFRNSWYHFPDGFDEFSKLIKKTWPSMEIQPVEMIDVLSRKLTMFCVENRIPRELFWAGFGFQVWCQLLTHISITKDNTVLIIDEPEIYLHPDVQRQLLNILRASGPDVLLATHSTEIMSEADHSEILLVDKAKRSALRLKDIEGVQKALEVVGSIQNITLTQLARNRKLIFIEGLSDFRVIRRFAQKLGLMELSSGTDLTAVESGGFSSWERILSFVRVFEKAIGKSVNIGVIYDRDYLPEEKVKGIEADLNKHLSVVHIHERKEIENYLLIPSALDKALNKAIKERARRSGEKEADYIPIAGLLNEITEPMQRNIQAQYMAKRSDYFEHSELDKATINAQTIKLFNDKWLDMDTRMEIVPGKEVLGKIRDKIQKEYKVNLTEMKIIDAIEKTDIPPDLKSLLQKLEEYRKKQ